MLASVRELARTLLAILETRARLAATELEEQAVRLVEIALWFALAILFLSVALVFVSVLVLLAFWDSNRMLAAGFLAVLYLSAGGAAALIARAPPARASAAPLRDARRIRQGHRTPGTPAMTRARLIALTQQRRASSGAPGSSASTSAPWPRASNRSSGGSTPRTKEWSECAAIRCSSPPESCCFVALRPRGAVKLLASSWSLWQVYQRARRLWTVAAAFASGAAAPNR
jgi:uncharacterized membrane protein YqjE